MHEATTLSQLLDEIRTPAWRRNDTQRRYRLLNAETARKLPPLGATEKIATRNKLAPMKLFLGTWTWYVVEASFVDEDGREAPLAGPWPAGYKPVDVRMFAWVDGTGYPEWGYVSLRELAELRAKPGFVVDRDLYWDPYQPVPVR